MNPLIRYRNLGTFRIPFDIINEINSAKVLAILRDCIVLGADRENNFGYIS